MIAKRKNPWKSLEAKIQKLVGRRLPKGAKLEDFIPVKTSREGKYWNIYMKVCENSCKFSWLVESEWEQIPFDDMVAEKWLWYGRCFLQIKLLFVGTSKTIMTIVEKEGFASDMKSGEFFFDDYSDED